MQYRKIQWHPAFYAAIKMMFRANKDDLEFVPEVILTKKPLQMDLLVIKKLRDTVIENRIGRMFRSHNIFEYKSPEDSLNIDTYYKVNGYACLYKVMERKVNECKSSDITISLVRDGYPRKLIKTLQDEGCIVERKFPGIYYVSGRTMFLTQIVVASELEEEERIWLQALRKNISQQTFINLMNKVDVLRSEDERQLASAVVNVTIRANKEIVTGWKETDENMNEALREIMAPELNEAKAQGQAQGRAQGQAEGKTVTLITMISKKIKKGKDVNTIADELEEDVEVVERICEAAKDCAPNYDVETIYNKLKKMVACL